jgi:rsbT co-antagonist protein RsbR
MTQNEKDTGEPDTEIAALRRQVAELERSVIELRSLFSAMSDIIIEVDWDGRVLRTAPTRFDPEHGIRAEDVGRTLHEIHPVRADELVSAARGAIETGKPVGVEFSVPHGDEDMWFMATAWPNSKTSAVVGVRDITERKRMDHAVRSQQDEMIRAQAAALAELSTPLIPISKDIVVMPLIGLLDSQRAQQVMSTLLTGISETGAEVAILDITGVSVVDTQVANGLIRAARAASLLGAEVVLTGIRPDVARTLVGLGADLQDIATRGTLQSGIAYAMTRHEEDEDEGEGEDDEGDEDGEG